jgi:LysR family transcriptional regulator, regulator of gene expression of beta-lactamase
VAERIARAEDLAGEVLLRSYRPDEWLRWFDAAGVPCPTLHGPVFDSSVTTAAAAMVGTGVALLPAAMFAPALDRGDLVRPFALEVETGRYWLARLRTRAPGAAMRAFRDWLLMSVSPTG